MSCRPYAESTEPVSRPPRLAVVTTPAVSSVTAQRAWGVAAVVVAAIALVPTAIVLALVAAVDEQYGWGLFISLPLIVAGGVLALLLGVVGVVFAVVRRRGFAWPVVGAISGLVLVLGVSLMLSLAN